MEVIIYKNHRGLLNTDDQSVMFYGVGFKTIIEAMKHLKDVKHAQNTYTGWYYNMNRGFRNVKTGEIYIDFRWLPNEKFAKEYVDLKKS